MQKGRGTVVAAEAALRLLLRLAAPGGLGGAAAAAGAHRLFVLNAIPRLGQVMLMMMRRLLPSGTQLSRTQSCIPLAPLIVTSGWKPSSASFLDSAHGRGAK